MAWLGNINTLAGNAPPKADLGDLRGRASGLDGRILFRALGFLWHVQATPTRWRATYSIKQTCGTCAASPPAWTGASGVRISGF